VEKDSEVEKKSFIMNKKKMNQIKLLFALMIVLLNNAFSQSVKHTFALGDKDFLLDGKPFQMISGEMHYERIPREYWRDRIRKAKAMGLNTIGTYVFWNSHEEQPGKYDFRGENDIAGFCRIAQEEGMWVVMRASPYVCAEWEFGGYPWWLLKDSTLKVRSKDPKFIAAYRRYIEQLSKQLVPLQITHGGNILLVSIENEYGSYSNDKEYLDINRKIFQDNGFDGLFFTCDGEGQTPAGYLPGVLPALNSFADTTSAKSLINKYHGGKGPYYLSEWYPGWFDSWGRKHSTTNIDQAAKELDDILSAGMSINMYMFHGGTTRGFMNGANMSPKQPYSPQTASYDYDAPLDESGNPTPKYMKFRAIIEKHLTKGVQLPPIPKSAGTITIDQINLDHFAPLYDNLPKPILNKIPLSMEELNQPYGLVLYRYRLKKGDKGLIKIKEMRDFATVYINRKCIGILDRRLKQDSLQIDEQTVDADLDIWVENNGRINYGRYLIDNRQGITKYVTLNGNRLYDWKMYGFPFNTVKKFKYTARHPTNGPTIYKGIFKLEKVGDTYLDMRQFGKGFVFLNGHNLGKYWYIGPTQTIYIPAVWLKKGKNEIEVFDQLKTAHKKINALPQPILNELINSYENNR
jgi:beta-galactosidase